MSVGLTKYGRCMKIYHAQIIWASNNTVEQSLEMMNDGWPCQTYWSMMVETLVIAIITWLAGNHHFQQVKAADFLNGETHSHVSTRSIQRCWHFQQEHLGTPPL